LQCLHDALALPGELRGVLLHERFVARRVERFAGLRGDLVNLLLLEDVEPLSWTICMPLRIVAASTLAASWGEGALEVVDDRQQAL